MPAVAINTKYVPLPEYTISNFLKAGDQGEFIIESTERKLPIESGYDLLFIKPQNNDLLFANSGIVSKIGQRDLVKGLPRKPGKVFSYENKNRYHHHFSFEIKKILDSNNKLSELEYSLPTIENYHTPQVHFQSQYRNLPDTDFQTIVNGWVYATRTVFGKLINALPRQNKLEFMIQAMDHFSTIDFRDTSISNGLDFLHQYIERRILSRGRLLVATDKIIRKELSDILAADDVGFIDPETHSVQNVSHQAKIFKELFDIEKKQSLENSLRDMLRTNGELEIRFEKLFKRRAWPVDLEK